MDDPGYMESLEDMTEKEEEVNALLDGEGEVDDHAGAARVEFTDVDEEEEG
eukprot:CAMPEP_0113947006 /NCGR_PEP_ID=MMETSP1339-20121228/61536_1 /TAXON_ID=94617 /ORGANISM="Fibrocapsa japonica" /LENGTH=50 /DNA_ID=CAMNT_0000953345 /DNA_START=142 /DNA_END=290 /DNA_ORIENTATION=+ /assembly_acc=CAM_ASM_000762